MHVTAGQLGENAAETLSAMDEVGRVLQAQGRYQAAADLHLHALGTLAALVPCRSSCSPMCPLWLAAALRHSTVSQHARSKSFCVSLSPASHSRARRWHTSSS